MNFIALSTNQRDELQVIGKYRDWLGRVHQLESKDSETALANTASIACDEEVGIVNRFQQRA